MLAQLLVILLVLNVFVQGVEGVGRGYIRVRSASAVSFMYLIHYLLQECKDNYDPKLCEAADKAGYCDDVQRVRVRKNCKKTCGFCF